MTSRFAFAILAALLNSAAFAQTPIAGEWMLTFDELGGPNVMRLSLTMTGERFTGTAGSRAVEGTVQGTSVRFTAGNLTATGTIDGGMLKGDATFPNRTVKWRAVRMPARPASPRTHDFEPSQFHLYFSSTIAPVLRIHPGDTVRTSTVDAGGVDKHGNRRSGGGNPETGPFYVEGALPNDTLVVRLNRVRLNRDWAQSGQAVMGRALEPGTVANAKWDFQFASRWKLDVS